MIDYKSYNKIIDYLDGGELTELRKYLEDKKIFLSNWYSIYILNSDQVVDRYYRGVARKDDSILNFYIQNVLNNRNVNIGNKELMNQVNNFIALWMGRIDGAQTKKMNPDYKEIIEGKTKTVNNSFRVLSSWVCWWNN